MTLYRNFLQAQFQSGAIKNKTLKKKGHLKPEPRFRYFESTEFAVTFTESTKST